jgi:nucleoside-diphosphate-sugar epimerase
MNKENKELLDTVFPNINIKGDIEEHKTLLSIDKAKKILGFKPEYSWRNIV